MSTIVVIPARWGSSRLPGKPLADILGRPMIQWVWDAACGSSADEVLIAVDDARVESACKGFGAQVVLTDVALESGSDRVAQALQRRGCAEDSTVVNLQGDEPMLPSSWIDRVAETLVASGADMATLAHPIVEGAAMLDPDTVKVVCDSSGNALYFSRAPIPWNRDAPDASGGLAHIGIYSYRYDYLRRFVALEDRTLERREGLEQLRAMSAGHRIAVSVVDSQAHCLGVDTPQDLDRAREWARAQAL